MHPIDVNFSALAKHAIAFRVKTCQGAHADTDAGFHGPAHTEELW